MTVQELISHLSKFPPNAAVLYRAFSEYSELDAEEVCLYEAEKREIILHKGRYMSWREEYKRPPDQNPEFVTVVSFPGN